jgi:hypothetical protein
MVLVAGPHRAKRRVRVTTGISAGGYVQVTPEPADALAAGNLVVVGLG